MSKSKTYPRLIPLRKKIYPIPINILDISSLDAFWEIFIGKNYEKYNKIKSGDLVLDIGGNVGIFTIKAAQVVGDKGKVIVIEPEPNNVKLIKENTKIFNNVTIIPKAVGSKSGKVELLIGKHSGSHSIYTEDDYSPNDKIISIQIDLLDNICKELTLNLIDFIKIDVEGWELEVLKGAINSLEKIKFFTIASYHSKEIRSQLTKFLENNNFKVINDGGLTHAFNNLYFTN